MFNVCYTTMSHCLQFFAFKAYLLNLDFMSSWLDNNDTVAGWFGFQVVFRLVQLMNETWWRPLAFLNGHLWFDDGQRKEHEKHHEKNPNAVAKWRRNTRDCGQQQHHQHDYTERWRPQIVASSELVAEILQARHCVSLPVVSIHCDRPEGRPMSCIWSKFTHRREPVRQR